MRPPNYPGRLPPPRPLPFALPGLLLTIPFRSVTLLVSGMCVGRVCNMLLLRRAFLRRVGQAGDFAVACLKPLNRCGPGIPTVDRDIPIPPLDAGLQGPATL